MAHTVPDNFLGLPPRDADYRTARFAVLPIPYEATTTFGVGTRDGPRAIITASQQVELYDEELGCDASRAGIATLEPLEPDARGPEAMHRRIYAAARPIVGANKFLIALGGEHSITSGLVRAVKLRHKDLSVLQLDAHADLRDRYQGTPYSHACVMRRIHDLGVPAVGVGIRNYSAEEARFIRTAKWPCAIRRPGIRAGVSSRRFNRAEDSPAPLPNRARSYSKAIFSARTCRESATWLDDVVAQLTGTVYVTIDIDGFDPAYAPGTGTPEPGGLDWYQVTDLLAAVARTRRIVAADVVEVHPLRPSTVTEFLAAKLIYRLIGLVSGSPTRGG